MRRLLFIVVTVLMLASCGQKSTELVSGNLSGVDSEFLLFFYTSDQESGTNSMDTVYVNNGKFAWSPCVDESGIVMIVDKAHFVDNITLYVVPGEQCIINGTMTDYVISGSQFYKDWESFHKLEAGILQARRDLINTIPADGEYDEDYDMAEYSAKERELSAQWNDIAYDYVVNNPDSDLSAYLIRENTSAEYVMDLTETVSDRVRNGRLGHLIESRLILIDSEATRQASRKTVYVGAVAPDFSLKTSTGETFTLSEHRGEYVMLDFWGTWCTWCIQGLPTLKEIVKTYKDKLTVVSVDTNDPESAWLKGIKDYQMDWIQVYNSKKDAVDSKFAVEGFPGYYIINPEGVIVMMDFGEPAHFVEKVGELISK